MEIIIRNIKRNIYLIKCYSRYNSKGNETIIRFRFSYYRSNSQIIKDKFLFIQY